MFGQFGQFAFGQTWYSPYTTIVHECHLANSDNLVTGVGAAEQGQLFQAFTPSYDHSVTAIEIKVRGNVDVPWILVAIHAADANHRPTGAALATSLPRYYTELPSDPTNYFRRFHLTSPLNLTNGTEYCIRIYSAESSPNNTTYVMGTYNSLYPLYPGNCGYTSDGGTTWNDYSHKDINFKVLELIPTIVEPNPLYFPLLLKSAAIKISYIDYPNPLGLNIVQKDLTVLPIKTVFPNPLGLTVSLPTPKVDTNIGLVKVDPLGLILSLKETSNIISCTILTEVLSLLVSQPSILVSPVTGVPVEPLVINVTQNEISPLNIYVVIPPEMQEALINPYEGGAWLWLVEITLPGYGTIRYARNTENIKYAGFNFEAFNLDLGLSKLTGDGSIPRIMVRLSQDPNHVLEDQMNDTEGGAGGTIKIIRVHEDYTDTIVTPLEMSVNILTGESDTEHVTFTLGIPNPLIQKIPLRRNTSKVCPYHIPALFKGVECQYTGEDTTCTGKFTDCKAKGNEIHWGGELGLDPNVSKA